jgi:chromosome segregation ATPase
VHSGLRQQLAALCRALEKSENEQAELEHRHQRDENMREEIVSRCEEAVLAATTARNAALQETALVAAASKQRELQSNETEIFLRSEIQRLNILLQEAENQLLNMSMSWSNEQRLIHQLQKQLLQSTASVQKSERELNSLQQNYRDRADAWEEEKATFVGELRRLKEEISRANQIAELRANEERQRSLQELNSRSEAFERAEAEWKRMSALQTESLHKELADSNEISQQKINSLQSELHAEKVQRLSIEKDLVAAEQHLRKFQDRVWKSSNATQAAETRGKGLEQELRAAREQLHSAASRSEVVQEYARSLERREAEKSLQIENITAQLIRESERANYAERSIVGMETDNAVLKQRLDALNRKEDEMQDTISRLREELTGTELVSAKLAEVERNLASMRDEASRFESDAAAAKSESASLRAEIDRQQLVLDQLQRDLADSADRATKAEQRCQGLEEGLEIERETSRTLQNQLNLAQAQASHLRLQFDSTNRQEITFSHVPWFFKETSFDLFASCDSLRGADL